MKISQAIDLYVQLKQNAGMRFDSPRDVLRSFLRYCGDIDLHRITRSKSPHFSRARARCPTPGTQTWHAAGLFRILDCTRSHEILSAATLSPLKLAELRSIYLLATRIALAS